MAIEADAGSFDQLDPVIENVELKVTVFPHEEEKVWAEVGRAGVEPLQRKVYFFDTRELALYRKHLVLRARVTQGRDDDSTVKLRPADLADDGLLRTDGIKVELDVVGDKPVHSAKVEGTPDRGEIEQVEAGGRPLEKLFSGKQERLFAGYAPAGISFDDLEVFGPVQARKWDLPLEGSPFELTVEEWVLSDEVHFVELSVKVSRDERFDARRAFQDVLRSRGIDLHGDPDAKTPKVLRHFAERLG